MLLKNCQTLVWPAQDKEAIVSETGFAYVFEHSLHQLHFSPNLGVKLNLWSAEGSGNSSSENSSIPYSINLHAVIYNALVKFTLWFLANVAFFCDQFCILLAWATAENPWECFLDFIWLLTILNRIGPGTEFSSFLLASFSTLSAFCIIDWVRRGV